MRTDLSNKKDQIKRNETHVIRVYTINEKGQRVLKNVGQFFEKERFLERQIVKKVEDKKINNLDSSKINSLVAAIKTLTNRRKCFCFQTLKQFFLFPEENQSSLMSVSPYDKIIFDDESIHTMVRMYETKEKENLIWGFLNLKFWKIYVKVLKFTKKIDTITNKMQKKNLKEGMKLIKLYSIVLTPKKSQAQSGLTRVISASVVSSKIPGQIYESEVKKIHINHDYIQNRENRDQYPKAEPKYKVTQVVSRQQKVQPSHFSTYSPSYRYASKSYLNNSPNNHKYSKDHIHQPQISHQTTCHNCQNNYYVQPHCFPNYSHCFPVFAHCHLILPQPNYCVHNFNNNCNFRDNCFQEPYNISGNQCNYNCNCGRTNNRRTYEENDHLFRSKDYDLDNRIDYMVDLEKDIEEKRYHNLRTSSVSRQFRR